MAKKRAFRHAKFVQHIDACRGGDPIRAFAREAGVPASTIVRIRAGKAPSVETFAKLMLLCGGEAFDFFDREAIR